MNYSLDEGIKLQEEADNEFVELCRKGRESFITIEELAANLAKARKATELIWEGRFSAIANTGVKVMQ